MNRDKGYNRESGGSLNKHMSEDYKRERSRQMKGRFAGPNNPMFGKPGHPHSEEWKTEMSKRFSGERNPMYGVHREKTQEECKAISDRQKGSGNSFYGKRHSEETRKKISDSKKKSPVRCIETNEKYESSNEAMRITGIHNSSILRAAKNHLTAGGYHWEFIA